MKKLTFLLFLICPNLQAQSLDAQVIVFGISSKYGKIEVVHSYFLLEPKDSSYSDYQRLITLNGSKYQVNPFEISIFDNTIKVCCKDSTLQNTYIGDNGEPDYTSILKNQYKLTYNKSKYIFSKIQLSYCKCPSYYRKDERRITNLICFPKKIIANLEFSNQEKKEIKNNLALFLNNPLVKQFHFGDSTFKSSKKNKK